MSFSALETIDAFTAAFAKIVPLEVSPDALWQMGYFCQGYPYLMQLAGYYLVERMDAMFVGGPLEVSVADVEAIEAIALEAYRANVLEPVLSALPESLTSYLRAMCDVQDEQGRIGSGDVAAALGKNQQQVSSYRQRLIAKRLIEPDGRGYARLVLPHIPDYFADPREELIGDPNQQWNRQSREG